MNEIFYAIIRGSSVKIYNIALLFAIFQEAKQRIEKGLNWLFQENLSKIKKCLLRLVIGVSIFNRFTGFSWKEKDKKWNTQNDHIWSSYFHCMQYSFKQHVQHNLFLRLSVYNSPAWHVYPILFTYLFVSKDNVGDKKVGKIF